MALSKTKKIFILLSLMLGAFVLLVTFVLVSSKVVSKFSAGLNAGSDAFEGKSGNVAILEINGVIMDPDETLKKIRELTDEKEDVKAVVVRISSPGGAVGPTQEILEALKELGKKKTLVCSFGDIAASGGYYVAMACPKIVSNPGTLTGSIGVIMRFMNLSELYHWAKVDMYVLKSGKFKDAGADFRPMTEDERRLLQEMLDNVHRQFKTAVREGRKLSPAVVESFADGRIFSGEQAKELGFVDVLGGEQTAINLAAEIAKIKGKPKVIREDQKRDRFSKFFDSSAEDLGSLENAITKFLSRAAPQIQLQPGVPYLLPAHMFAPGATARSSR